MQTESDESGYGVDVVGQEILAKVLNITGYTRGILASDRSPKNVVAREQIYSLLRSCNHPDCAQLSLRRIARLVGTDVANVRLRIQKHGEIKNWLFETEEGLPTWVQNRKVIGS